MVDIVTFFNEILAFRNEIRLKNLNRMNLQLLLWLNMLFYRLRGGSDVDGGSPLEIIKVTLKTILCFDDI